MNVIGAKHAARAFLLRPDVQLSRIARETSLTKSWLYQFRRGTIDNPTIERIDRLLKYRDRFEGRAA
jgi:transcriptional regulator with XRE-family HTH domain